MAAPQTPEKAFSHLQAQLDALSMREPTQVTAGHANLGDGLWMSCDGEGKAEMTCRPDGPGFHLTVSEAHSGDWACLGMRLPVDVLARGRYFGLLLEAEPEALVSFAPVLRYYDVDGDMYDKGPDVPVVLPTGPNRHLSYIPIDTERLDRTKGCELNLFFQGDHAALRVSRIEPLLLS